MKHRQQVRTGLTVTTVILAGALIAGCTATTTSASSAGSAAPVDAAATIDTSSIEAATTTDSAVFDNTTVHEIAISIDPADVEELLAEYQSTGEKEWASATVTIDGQTFEDVGIRLKGNSSLRQATTDSDPAELPWLIRLDKYVDDQSLDGYTEFVVRSNTTETSLNEAVALELLELAGLASEETIATRFSVNGGQAQLRLVVQNLDETWEDEHFDTAGILYKAESTGDYSYRGDDPDAYEDVFDQETGEEDNLEPLMAFLEFIETSTDEDFAAELPAYLDVESFATYLAFEDLINNFDDIDGPGNNSFLRWDEGSGQFTVVAWDHNMAFGISPSANGGPGAVGGDTPGPAGPPARGMQPGGEIAPDAMAAAPQLGGSNPLVERFLANEEFQALYDAAAADLQASLVDSGAAEQTLDAWVDLLTGQAGDLVDEATVASEAAAISAHFD